MQKDASNIQINDISFCPSTNPLNASLMACAVSVRVDIYKSMQPDGEFDIEYDSIKPKQSLFKFTDVVTSCQLRQDAALLVTGEANGNI